MDIIDKLNDLHKQATVERSHYYVGSTVKEAATVISGQRIALEMIKATLVGQHNAAAAAIVGMADVALREGRE